MTDVMCMSNIYAPTLKEDPSDAEIASHRLLLRAGMIRKTASGVYTFLPLGKRVLSKIENIVRDEMNAIGAQEIMMPALQPAEIWHESGRWNDYGPELMRLNDRHNHGFCLGPTHEELITSLIRNELKSYKDLPTTLYQIQVKFRDEIRPRFGLLRSREFIMKDAYSFNETQQSLQETFDAMSTAYGNICDRCGLEYRPVEADCGQIGGSVSTEFMALADAGEAQLVYCDCGFAANTEAGQCDCVPTVYDVDFEKIATPGISTIDELAKHLNIPQSSTVKALVGKDAQGQVVALFIPGNHELNEIKVNKVVCGFKFLSDEEMKNSGLPKGSIGPANLHEDIKVIADKNLSNIPKWTVGANEDGYHYVGARLGKDFQIPQWEDLCTVQVGDACPVCKKTLMGARGIEVSQVFQLGDKYSRAMNATYLDENGKEQFFVMGCYGVGVTRSLAAVVEQHNDEHGIIWPASVAPAHVCVIPLSVDDDVVFPTSEKLACSIAQFGFEVVIDDRKQRPGVKFAEADLFGWPLQIVVGRRGLDEGSVEIKVRHTLEKRDVAIDKVIDAIAAVKNSDASINSVNYFDKIFNQAAK